MEEDGLAGLCLALRAPVAVGFEVARQGWTVRRLATLQDIPDVELLDLVDHIHELAEVELELEVDGLRNLVDSAAGIATRMWREERSRGSGDWLQAHRESEQAVKRRRLDRRAEEVARDKVTMVGTARRYRWPTRLGRRLARAEEPQQREEIEKEERRRWLDELRTLLHRGNAPVAQAVGLRDMGEITNRIGKGRRALTLIKHVKVWARFEAWMLETFGYPWPRRAKEVAVYLESRASEPCGPSVPAAFYKTLMFMEFAGEVEEDARLHNSVAVRNTLEEINLRLSEGPEKVRRQAKLIPATVIEAMERIVVDETEPFYHRAFAWYKLIKVWSCARFSDTTGLPWNSVGWDIDGLTGELVRTKTTGPGKKVWKMAVHVCKRAWLAEPEWLFIGYILWKDMGKSVGLEERDYLLPKPTEQLALPRRASVLPDALWGFQNGPEEGAQRAASGEGCRDDLHGALRASYTIRTWAEAASVPAEIAKRLGRWSPTTDEGYVRAQRSTIIRAQEHIAFFVRGNKWGGDPMDEEQVFKDMGRRLRSLGYHEDAVEEQKERLRYFDKSARTKIKHYGWTMLDVHPQEKPPEPNHPPPGHFPDFVPNVVAMLDSDSEAELGIETREIKGMYVVSILAKQKTLHKVGECYRAPGRHYQNYEVMGYDLPEPKEFHAACKACFASRGGAGMPVGGGRDGQSEGDSAASSSDTGSEE